MLPYPASLLPTLQYKDGECFSPMLPATVAFISSLKLIKKPSLSVLTARQRALIYIRFPPSILIESGYKGLSQASRLPLAVIYRQYTTVRAVCKWKGLRMKRHKNTFEII